jgi:putative transposase
VAIDWHLVPYYGRPYRSRNEICRSQPKQGTAQFHTYATACVVEYGRRYTVALTWVRRHESMVTVLRRLLARIRAIGLKIKCFLLDRAFFNFAVIEFLQQENLPFLMPVKFAGRHSRKRRKATGLRALKGKPAGRYSHTMTKKKREVSFTVYVNYRSYRDRRTGEKRHQKLLFAAWRVTGSPTEIRERYRGRFGIETSYRQRRQARIYTCTRDPHVRLFFVALSFILRNVWVWIHQLWLAEGSGDTLTLHLELLRFKRMLDWIARQVIALYHDGTAPYVPWPP